LRYGDFTVEKPVLVPGLSSALTGRRNLLITLLRRIADRCTPGWPKKPMDDFLAGDAGGLMSSSALARSEG